MDSLEHFLQRGYLVIPPCAHPGLHASVHAKATAIAATGSDALWRLADDVLPAIPELYQVLNAPPVRSALTSVLGDGYMLHGHRHLHVSSEVDQMWHKDSYWGFRLRRRHRPRWCMMLYYPQDTTLSMGPTCVLAGSQYWTVNTALEQAGEDILRQPDNSLSMHVHGKTRHEKEQNLRHGAANLTSPHSPSSVEEVAIAVPAGSCVLMHYELFHRASARQDASAPQRFMVKFQFLRTTEPRRQTLLPCAVPPPARIAELEPVLADVRSWLSGERTRIAGATSPGVVDNCAGTLLGQQSGEPRRIMAAYTLGQMGQLNPLITALLSGEEASARAASYGFAAAGPQAVTSLLALLRHSTEEIRGLAAFALGECGIPGFTMLRHLQQVLAVERREGVQVELLQAIGIIASRARALGQESVCGQCSSIILPYLAPKSSKCIVGESACIAVLQACGLSGVQSPEVLRALTAIASGQEPYMASFAAEVIRRQPLRLNRQLPLQVLALPRAPLNAPSASSALARAAPIGVVNMVCVVPHPVSSLQHRHMSGVRMNVGLQSPAIPDKDVPSPLVTRRKVNPKHTEYGEEVSKASPYAGSSVSTASLGSSVVSLLGSSISLPLSPSSGLVDDGSCNGFL